MNLTAGVLDTYFNRLNWHAYICLSLVVWVHWPTYLVHSRNASSRSLAPRVRSDPSTLRILCNNHPFVSARHGFTKIEVANGSIIWEFWYPTGSFMTRLPNPHKPVRCMTYSNRVRYEHIGFSEGLQVDADFVLDPFVRLVKPGPDPQKRVVNVFSFPHLDLCN